MASQAHRPLCARAVATMAAVLIALPVLAWQVRPSTVTLTAQPPLTYVAGKPAEIRIALGVTAGYHIQANTVPRPYIPAKLTLTLPAGFKAGKVTYPTATKLTIGSQAIEVFEGNAVLGATVTPPRTASGPQTIAAKLAYQACDATRCYMPTSTELQVTLTPSGAVAAASAPGNATPRAPVVTPAAMAPGPPPGYVMTKLNDFVTPDRFIAFLQAGGAGRAGGEDTVTRLLSGNLALALLTVFVLGLALNLTPCVYPIIPITLAYFGGQVAQTGRKPLVLAIFYVLGMAAMYSTLGVVAGLTRGVFGSQLQNPWVLSAFAAVMFGLALSQFDRPDGRPIWEFQLPASLRDSSGPRSGVPGAVLMGLLVGVVAAPCVGPAVVALLQFVAAHGSPLLGFALFFTLSLGLGLPYVVLATVSGSVKRLPRSGEWMLGVKHIFGIVMIGMGFYYLQPVLDRLTVHLGTRTLIAVIFLGAGYLLFLDHAGASARVFSAIKRVVAVLAIAGGVAMLPAAPKEAIAWQPLSDQALASALAQHRSVLIDFRADWCVECKQLEQRTYSDAAVGAAARDFVALRGDMTNGDSASSKEWTRRFEIAGLPTVIRLAPR